MSEQGGFNERLGEILTQVAWYGSYKRSGEQPEGPTLSPGEARTAIRTLVLEEIIGKSAPEYHDPTCFQHRGLEYCHCPAKPEMIANTVRAEQRLRLGGTHGTK